MTEVHFPTLTETGYKTSGFLDKDSAQTYIDKNIMVGHQHRWHISTERFFADYAEYEETL